MLWYKLAAPNIEEIIRLRKEHKEKERAKQQQLQKQRERLMGDKYKVPPAPPPPGSNVPAPAAPQARPAAPAAPQARPAPVPTAPNAPSAAPRTPAPNPMRAAPMVAPQVAPSPMTPKQWGLSAPGQEPGRVFQAPPGMKPAVTPAIGVPATDRASRLEEGRTPEMEKWLQQRKQKRPI